jgi:hypothetical protein
MKPNIHQRLKNKNGRVYLLMVSILILGVLVSIRETVNSQRPIPLPLPETTVEINQEIYEPAYYGLPDNTGGYKVLAVISSQNTECLQDGIIEVVIQTNETTLEQLEAGNSSQDIREAVMSLGIPGLRFSIAGPHIDKATFIRENERWNSVRKMNGCMKFTPPSFSSPVF